MKFNVTVTGGTTGADIKVTERGGENGVYYLDVSMVLPEKAVPKSFMIEWKIPMHDMYCTWKPDSRKYVGIQPDWNPQRNVSRLASGLPILSVLSLAGKNRIAIAISDAKTPTLIRTGACENDAHLTCRVDFFTIPVAPLKEYCASVRVDMRDVPYYDSLYDITAWWENECGYVPTSVPEHARLPMNSLWYSFHQALSDNDDIINECKLSKPLGMDTVLVDDGWQCDNDSRGYAYCGDWEVIPSKIPDMREFVKRIHETGMKIILWYSVPFIGVYSKNYERFKDMLLDDTGDRSGGKWRCVDPRYKEVRDFLVNTYVTALKEWDLDGFKLDFIDSFELRGKSLEYDARRDYQSLEDAIDALMTEIRDQLMAIKSDILIEFRQSYVGPAIRKYGNMLRVADCPNDSFTNRIDIVNLRYTSGKTAVHSDMIMWNYDEPVESAALQFVNILYSVPQISMRMARLNDEHKKMLTYYLAFWRENRDVLLGGKLMADKVDCSYPLVRSVKDGKAVFTAYGEGVIPCTEYDSVIAVNGSGSSELILRGAKGRSYRVVNCMGEETGTGVVECDLASVSVPTSGMIFVEK